MENITYMIKVCCIYMFIFVGSVVVFYWQNSDK